MTQKRLKGVICSAFRRGGSEGILLPPNRRVWKRQNQRYRANSSQQPQAGTWEIPALKGKSSYYEGDKLWNRLTRQLLDLCPLIYSKFNLIKF